MDKPISLEEIRRQRKPIIKISEAHKSNMSLLDKFALWITQHVGTMGFFISIFIWTASWLTWNTIGPDSSRFDPFPAFVLWLFISNMIQIFLMPLLLIGQNLQNRESDLKSEAMYEIDKRSEREVEAILQHLEYIESLLEKK